MSRFRRVARWTAEHVLPVSASQLSPVVWANTGPIGRWWARVVQPGQVPVVIMSLPRSGSSWVGKMLGNAPSALYLHEPINQSILAHTDLPTLFEVTSSDTERAVRSFTDDVFAAYPAFDRSVVKDAGQWSWMGRKGAQLVVKEVNPFVYSWLQRRYTFKTIYLVRHPGAVAASYHRLEWTDEQFEHLPTVQALMHQNHRAGFWTRHGTMQAIASRVMRDALDEQRVDRYHTVRYEDVCARPVQAFRKLFSFAGLEWTRDDADRIRKHTTSSNARRTNTYSVQRDSAEMINIWRDELSTAQFRSLRDAYLQYNPPLYADAW